MQVLKRLRKLIKDHRFRSQIAVKVSKRFGHESGSYLVLMRALDEVVETHDRGRRKSGDFLKSHEFAMFIIALEYCKITDVSTLLAILLHDMREDYPELWTEDRFTRDYGQKVWRIVDAVTKPNRCHYQSEQAYDSAIFRKVVEGGDAAMDVKCIDRLHNMLTLVGPIDKRRKKVVQTIRYVLPIAAERDMLLYELMQATNEQLRLCGMRTTST